MIHLAGAPYSVNDHHGSVIYETLGEALDGLLLRGLDLHHALTMCTRLALTTNPMEAVFDWLILHNIEAVQALVILGEAVLRGIPHAVTCLDTP